ncbi:type II secretion system minor pseudopilin GspJ [Kangiella sediminilitoris]|uniref:Type II secretion system protein J n=1 Tax=Kangiella sediminilitoris TaxID=1144748 RepID=A0A1B3B889_9GAMM|nr:type II secretion system minor pseudopilin GspJ [Kangiella sediminilitoris]AOE49024.1 General secretion pathway protein J [Kangiella sediminilitoris]
MKLNRAKGFTLTEVLIALFIFSIVVAGALQVFNFVQITSQSADKQIERLREVQLAFRQLEEDIRYLVPRDRRNVFGDKAPLLKADSESANSYIEFTRAGWRNPAKLKRSSLQHVKYEFLDDRVVRHHWLYVDSAREGQELTRDMLTRVEDFKLEFLSDDIWKKSWLVDGQQLLSLPEAIKVTIKLEDYGELYRLFPMPRYTAMEQQEENAEREDPTSGGTDNNGRSNNTRGGGYR